MPAHHQHHWVLGPVVEWSYIHSGAYGDESPVVARDATAVLVICQVRGCGEIRQAAKVDDRSWRVE